LFAAGAGFHFVPKAQTLFLQCGVSTFQVIDSKISHPSRQKLKASRSRDLERHSIPTTRVPACVRLAWSRAGTLRTADPERQRPIRDLRKDRAKLLLDVNIQLPHRIPDYRQRSSTGQRVADKSMASDTPLW
jgi:hypothetical protein